MDFLTHPFLGFCPNRTSLALAPRKGLPALVLNKVQNATCPALAILALWFAQGAASFKSAALCYVPTFLCLDAPSLEALLLATSAMLLNADELTD